MNIFELTIFILFIVSGYFSGKFLSCYYGVLGWIIGFIVGCSLFALIYYLIIHYSNKLFPIDPPCKTGKCLSDGYKIVEYNEKKGSVYRCACGTKYLKKLPYFKEILPDGTTKPYMKKNKKGRWEPDTESGAKS